MSVSVTELFSEHTVIGRQTPTPVLVEPDTDVASVEDLEPAPWYDGLSFSGPLDPAGTLFAFLLALVATVGMVVLVAAVVRMVSAG